MAGVERKRLDRVRSDQRDEMVTTVVRFAPGSHFSPHVHTGGEEFLVLDGVFQDDLGEYPEGTYVRNPPTSSHEPGSVPGCTILVKLWQFDLADRHSVKVNTTTRDFEVASAHSQVKTIPLFSDKREDVAIEYWPSGQMIALDCSSGMEVYVLEGSFSEQGDIFIPGSWLRLPPGSKLQASIGEVPVKVWVKYRHISQLMG